MNENHEESAEDALRRHLQDTLRQIAAYEKDWAPKRDLVEARHRRDETQKLLDRALAQVAERDAQLRNQELTISHLHGQVAALDRVFAMGQEAAARAMFGPQINYAELDRGYASLAREGLDEDDVPPRREEPALTVVQQRVTEQLKSAGIDTSSICGYEWDLVVTEGCSTHACGIVNPLHLGDHECEQGCGAKCSQREAERIEEAKQRAT